VLNIYGLISVENVADGLNATGTYEEASDTYTVFGIPVAAITISAIMANLTTIDFL